MPGRSPAGDWVATVRRAQALTQAGAARRGRITERAWQKVEAGHPISPRIAAAITAALELDQAGAAHLHRLIRPPHPRPAPPARDRLAPVAAAIGAPAWIIDPAWTVLAASPAAGTPPRNLARWAVAASGWQDRPRIAAQLVARTRALTSWFTETPKVHRMIAALSQSSPAAATAWAEGLVADTPPSEDIRYAGYLLRLDWAWLGSDPSTRLMMITAVDGEAPRLPCSMHG